jgi:uncharacterized repeat protein (TIGR01451 family)
VIKAIRRLSGYVASALVLVAALQTSAVQAAYVPRYSITTNGAITFTGNTLGLDGNGAGSTTPGTSGSIGAFTSTTVTTSSGTFPPGTTAAWASNGSAANLRIPAGSTVLYAELIWGGSWNNTSATSVLPSVDTNITFVTPTGNYSIAPDAATSQIIGATATCAIATPTSYCRYVRSANVTGLVTLGASGNYEVRGVPATVSADANNNTAGWTLAVVYSNTSLPPRNMTVFVGIEAGGNAATGVSGFCTNLAGPVKGRLLVSAMEGDASIVGDQMNFGPTTGTMIALGGPNNSPNNFFSGQINGDTGVINTLGTFGTTNHNGLGSTSTVGGRQGYDITNVDVSAAMINNQTSAVARGTTTGDQYTINALAIQIDVGAPKFPLTVKSANRTITNIGDIVTYSVIMDNTTGTANANNVVFTDTPPPGMSFVPGSVTVAGVSQPSFNPLSGFNVGTIVAGATRTVTFQVQVNAIPAAPALAQYENRARWTYDFISCAGFPTEVGTLDTSPNIIPIVRLAPTKTVTPTGPVGIGQVLTYTISVPNTGQTATIGATVSDPIPSGTTYVPNSTKLNGVAVPDIAGAMPFATANQINSAGQPTGVVAPGTTATVQFNVQVGPSPPAIMVNTAQVDPDGAGNAPPITVTATNTPLTPPVASKLFTPATISAGATSVVTINVSNANATALTLAALSDTLPAGVVIANPPNAATTCGAGVALATAGGITLGLSGGTVPISGNCTVTADVTASAAGTYINVIPIGGVTTANGGSNSAQANATLTVVQGPSVNKSFSPAAIAPGGISTLTISLINPTGAILTSANLNDSFPAGLKIAPTPNVVNNCGGVITAVAGSSTFAISNASIPATNLCTVSVQVTSSIAGSYNNLLPVGALVTSGGSNATLATADITVAAPLISKGFTPNVVGVNVNSDLTITLTNLTNTALTGVTFTDVFPTTPGVMSLAVAAPVSNTCGGPLTNQAGGALAIGATGIKLTGGTLPAGGACSITVTVKASVGGNYVNTIGVGGLTTTNGGSNTSAAVATLAVGLPSVEKLFGSFATTVPVAAQVTNLTVPIATPTLMQIRLNNPNPSALAITTLTDVFPPGMTLANTTINSNSCTGGSFTDASGAPLAAGSTGIRLNGGSIAANSSCFFSINLQANSAGLFTNSILAGGLVTAAGANPFPVSASISALARPTVAKAFTPSTISAGAVSSVSITLTNSNSVTITGATFTDTFPISPAPITLANTTATNTCGGTLTNSAGGALAVGSTGIRLTGGNIPGNGSCTITVNVTASTLGAYTNRISSGGLSTVNAGSNVALADAVLTVKVLPPILAKSFFRAQVGKNLPVTLTLSVTNPNIAGNLTTVSFVDNLPNLPSQMLIAPTPNLSSTGCGTPTLTGAAGATSVGLSNATVVPGTACTVSVDVVASVAGQYNNVSDAVNSGNGGLGNTAQASVRVLERPSVSKGFAPASVNVGVATALTLTISNPNPSDQLTGVAVNDPYPSGLVNTASPSPALFCTGGSGGTITGGVANGNSVGITSGILAPGGYCQLTINVQSNSVGSITNLTGNVTSSNAGTGLTATAVLSVGVNVGGFVYNDSNLNNTKDGAETGTGLALFAKLISAGSVIQVVPVNSATGAYLFSGVVPGNYTVIIDDNNNPVDITPALPANWTGTESPAQSRSFSVGAAAVANQNFGLSNAVAISGRVFRDNGAASGIANDGLVNGGELGIAGVTVKLTNCAATVLATTVTDGAGNFSLAVPASVANGTNLCIVETNPSGFISTGGAAGSSGGTYARASDTISFTYVTGASVNGLLFGDVPVNTLSTDGVRSALAGTSVNYAHTFVAGSGGTVTFGSAAIAAPAVIGWSEVFYRDTNCDGLLDPGEPVISGAINVNAGDTVCIIVKEFVPAGAPIGASNQVTVSATFAYTNAAPVLNAVITRTDTTTVGTASSAGLTLNKSVDKAAALPGDILTYTIVYRNDSSGPLNTLVINDNTPAFTTFLSAACAPNPPVISACAVTTLPILGGTGAIVWTLTGTLMPGSTSSVTFSVKVAN